MTIITRIGDPQREQLRRAVAGPDQGPTAEQQDANHLYPFINRMHGGLSRPQDPTDVSFPFLRRMRRDHMVAMGLHFIDMEIVSAPWYYQADDARVATAADKLVRPIYGDLVLTILRFLWSGFSPAARNYDFIQPTWTFYEDGKSKKVWDNGTIDFPIYKSITPLIPERARPAYKNGNFNGILYDERYGGPGGFIVDGQTMPNIDLQHSIWAVHDRIGQDGNPYGYPRIAHCAPIFWMFRYIWDLLARAFENNADPGPLMRYPEDPSETRVDSNGRVSPNALTALKIGKARRSGSITALPSDVWKTIDERFTAIQKWGIDYPKNDTDFEALMNFIGYLEAAKLRAIFIPEQGLVDASGGSSSNRNVASEFGDQRQQSQKVLMMTIDNLIDEIMVRPIINMTFPFYTGELKKVTFGLGDDDSDLVRQMFQLIGQDDWASFGVNARKMAEMNNFPMLDPAEQAKLLEERKATVNKSQTPTVSPTQGRRALVTQSGFGETVYHQLGGRIDLVDVALSATADGDFVARLPREYLTTAQVKEARMLRAGLHAFLAHCYVDASRHAKESPEDPASTWQPATQRVDAFVALADARWQGLSGLKTATGESTAAQAVERVRRSLRDALSVSDAADVFALADDVARAQASDLALSTMTWAVNQGIVESAHAASIGAAQLLDAGRGRLHGTIMSLDEARKEVEMLPAYGEQVFVRPLPRASFSINVRREQLDEGVHAMYDHESETILVSIDTSAEEETKFMLELGDVLALPAE